ncbi:MAG: hypothetical protein EOP06_22355, partial [Proteobacteria bacterium]
LTPDNKIVVIVVNTSNEERTFIFAHHSSSLGQSLTPGAVATYIFR